MALTRLVRRWRLGALSVRALEAPDAPALLAFLSAHPSIPAPFLVRQLCERWGRQGAAVGAFAHEALVGFAFFDRYSEEGVTLEGHWVRLLSVAAPARRLGVGRRIVECLCGAAAAQGCPALFADIEAGNRASLALFSGAGFTAASASLTRAANAQLGGPYGATLVVLERRLGGGPRRARLRTGRR